MPKKKKKEDEWLPLHCRRGRSAYEYVKNKKTVRLAALDAPKWEVLEAYRNYIDSLTTNATVKSLILEYFKSHEFNDLGQHKQKQYRYKAQDSHPLMVAFGKHHHSRLQARDLKRYRQNRKKTHKSGVLVSADGAARDDLKFLRAVYKWAVEESIVSDEHNVVPLVKKGTDNERDRYIEDYEFDALIKCAHDSYNNTGIMLECALTIAYRCGMRMQDVLNLTRNNLTEDGILVTQLKIKNRRKDVVANRHNTQLKLWTKEVRAAVDTALSMRNKIESAYIIRNSLGQPYTVNGFRSNFNRVRKRASQLLNVDLCSVDYLVDGKIVPNPNHLTMHDFKAKGVSDFGNDLASKQAFSAHKDPRMVRRYDRRITKSPTLGAPEKAK